MERFARVKRSSLTDLFVGDEEKSFSRSSPDRLRLSWPDLLTGPCSKSGEMVSFVLAPIVTLTSLVLAVAAADDEDDDDDAALRHDKTKDASTAS
jgi:hypothetical protein